MNQELFEIKLNSEARSNLRRFTIVARWVILAGIGISLVHIISTVFHHIDYSNYDLENYPLLKAEYKFLPYYTALYCILFYSQLYCYWKAARLIRKALRYSSTEIMTSAFRSLWKYAAFTLATVLLSFASYGFELFRLIKGG